MEQDIRFSWRRALKAGAWSSIASSIAIAAGSRLEAGHSAAGTNATSQWLFGEDVALEQDSFSLRYTGTGYAIHHVMSVFWAAIHLRWREAQPSLALPLSAASVTALAAFVDLRLMPPRFSPGFEKRVGTRSLTAVYLAYAMGLAAAEMLRRPDTNGRGNVHRRDEPDERERQDGNGSDAALGSLVVDRDTEDSPPDVRARRRVRKVTGIRGRHR